MSTGEVGGISGGKDIQWNKQLAGQLDAADGKKDGKIDASIWNGFLDKAGSSGNRIKTSISVDKAAASLNYYDKSKDAGKVDWNDWQGIYNDFAEGADFSAQPAKLEAGSKAPEKSQTPVYYDDGKEFHNAQIDTASAKDQVITDQDGGGEFHQAEIDTAPVKDQTPVYYKGDNVHSAQEQNSPLSSQNNSEVSRKSPLNSQTPAENNSDKSKKLTSEDIQKAIADLDPGESYTYVNSELARGGIGISYSRSPVTWRRESDSTLTKTTSERTFDSNGRGFTMSISERYSADGKTLISKETPASSLRFAKELKSTEFYENGTPSNLTTDLSNIDKQLSKLILQRSGDSVSRLLRSLSSQPAGQSAKFSTQEFKDSDGNSVVIFKDNKFFNAKGKEISFDKAHKILSELKDDNRLSTLVQNYE